MEPDIEIYRKVLNELNPKVSADEWDYFKTGLAVKKLKSREFFIESGKRNHLLGFVTSGLIRAFYINHLGEDITISFIKEFEYATDYPSLLVKKPSRYNFQCLEPTTVVTVPYHHIQNGYEKFAGFERNGRLIAEDVLKRQQSRIESFQFDNAEHRYLDFVKKNPELFNRISLTHLSSYLGIERPSLSRIRKKIVGL
ncbi:Crp/Fnr family transcriptional regulator [Mucilaginibacter sp. X5P1]|uniref:Crp/Fnr family transcriptional regulator n=1 Tax=Mucilaginibacter sp. X5P1 TaxID=2723088 RepID=UPI001609A85C|nr:Crp/Fnr family transcriptional regulator [Mucilaginibacter sp. X5P1]MBB6136873.1 CRP-like cAMP-binding protein [Mucilaginibacter sp. X5P1]